jgi:hypothetical protein
VGKFLLVIVTFAAVVYTLFWLVERRHLKKSAPPRTSRPASYERGLGPDDDEEFLRQLEQRRRRAAHEQPPPKPGDAKSTGDQADQPGKPEQGKTEQGKTEQDRPRPE